MSITSEITKSIDAQDQAAWQSVCDDATDPFMKVGFIQAAERSAAENRDLAASLG